MSYGNHGFGYPEGVSIVDIAPDYLRPVIHPHWAKYPPVNPMWHTLLGVIYLMLGAISVSGNGMVIYLFLKVKTLRTPTNLLIFNLAILDLNMLVTNFPVFTYNCFSGGVWMFSTFYCEIYALCGTVTGIGSLLSHVFITWDRYNVIVHGVGGKPMTFGKAAGIIVFIYAYSIGISIPPLLGWGKYIPEGILDSCSYDYLSRDWNTRSFGIFMFVTCYALPLLTIIYSYVFIVKAIIAHEAVMAAQAKKMNVASLRSGTEGESAEMRVAKTACINVSLWLICWTPYCAITVKGLFFDQEGITPLVTMLPALLAKSLSCYNPMVYALSHPRFRKAMEEHIPCCCVIEPEAAANPDNKSNATEAEKN